METSSLQKLVWIYCPWHAGVCGYDKADILVSRAPITGILKMGRANIMQTTRDNLMRSDKTIEKMA